VHFRNGWITRFIAFGAVKPKEGNLLSKEVGLVAELHWYCNILLLLESPISTMVSKRIGQASNKDEHLEESERYSIDLCSDLMDYISI
jgi:hypothetical protein